MPEQNTKLSTRQTDRIDQTTGLPRMASALADLTQLMRDNQPNRILGVIALAVVPDAKLFRRSADSVHKLRIEASQKMRSLLRSQDRIYTISQREWLIILPNLISSSALTLAMIRLRDGLASIEKFDGLSHLPRLAIGSAQWPDDSSDPLFLVQSARIARLFAEHGNADIQSYKPEMEVDSDDQQGLQNDLRQALHNNRELALYLQPQIEITTGRCTGAEALLRWQRSNGEWVSPPIILEAIDRLGLRQTFNRWLLQQATQIQLQLAEQGIDIVLSINLSANDLLDTELPDMIGQALATWDIAPSKFLLEITETMMVEESWQVMDVLNRMRKLGLRLSIDDFGTGYSGMSYLQRLPVQEVKIDQMFVRQVAESEKAREIITSVIQLATRLKMSVIAEGVETAEILGIISSLGCRFAQGYFYSKAIDLPEFINWWKTSQSAEALLQDGSIG
ncbi:MAG: EAL domain-containing protein [Dechloromonas sp.]|uniref:EAL domain-containing protein n=1 Tax=Candidatus Dechloromonas phosphorivorans TaxID=2899244 RepID=A0A935JW84_9RHOO|nr:EAL domain-containing protein [Candidatus Dechloromonas phosphorivorans]